MITVKELIKELKKFDEDQLVVFIDPARNQPSTIDEVGQTPGGDEFKNYTDKAVVYVR